MDGRSMEAWIPGEWGMDGTDFLSPPQSGEIEIVNHRTGDKCILKFVPYSYFSRDVARKVGTRSHGTHQAARDSDVS